MKPRLRSRGMSTVTALFLVTVMASLAAAGVVLLSSGREASTLEMQAFHARQAAEAGIDWGLYRVHRVGGAPCAASTTLVGMPGPLAPYTVTVTCLQRNYDESGTPVIMYELRATACNQPAGGMCPNPDPGAVPGALSRYVEQVVQRTTAR